MTTTTTLTAVHYLGAAIVVLIVLLAIACWWAYRAFERGSSIPQAEVSTLRTGQALARQKNAELKCANASLKHQLLRSRENAAQALEQQQLNHEQELQALRDRLNPLSERDISTIGGMAEKLNLAANALHATGSFKQSREAKNLASSGFRIVDDLNRARATQEAA
ncbi:sensor histidine kinase [Pseudomonas abyssi]|uniref:DNA recombination protein RmuC n=1 Tax=Pseudomonas abyssi TaxID=170540 RepID=A0A395RA97_9PSED|nr:hypothetical protein [Halopseudomonas gallaeciensis]RGP57047.1 hypothetical protein ASB58_06860 [Halopseudomonas gallaeciensis]